jgi:hypothetical protein
MTGDIEQEISSVLRRHSGNNIFAPFWVPPENFGERNNPKFWMNLAKQRIELAIKKEEVAHHSSPSSFNQVEQTSFGIALDFQHLDCDLQFRCTGDGMHGSFPHRRVVVRQHGGVVYDAV